MLGPPAEVFTPTGIVKYFGFLQIYDRQSVIGGIGQAWTLCVEVSFYVMVPLWAWGLRRLPSDSPRRWLQTELAMLAGLVAFSILWKVEHPQGPHAGQAAGALVPALAARVRRPLRDRHDDRGAERRVGGAAGPTPDRRDHRPDAVGALARWPLIGFAILGYQSRRGAARAGAATRSRATSSRGSSAA